MRSRIAMLGAAAAMAAGALLVPRNAAPASPVEGFACDTASCTFSLPTTTVSIDPPGDGSFFVAQSEPFFFPASTFIVGSTINRLEDSIVNVSTSFCVDGVECNLLSGLSIGIGFVDISGLLIPDIADSLVYGVVLALSGQCVELVPNGCNTLNATFGSANSVISSDIRLIVAQALAEPAGLGLLLAAVWILAATGGAPLRRRVLTASRPTGV